MDAGEREYIQPASSGAMTMPAAFNVSEMP